MAHGLSRIQFPDSGMDLTKLSLLPLYICGYGLGGQKGFGTFGLPRQRIQTLFRH